jgi:predicted GH43/DUF377 family glycosyl hydrolase
MLDVSEGWLVTTHGVGTMRKYCIATALLDLNDSTKVVGCLRELFLYLEGKERERYVTHVTYSCGSLIHGG